jgi:hypothetical protein
MIDHVGRAFTINHLSLGDNGAISEQFAEVDVCSIAVL